MDYSLKDKVNFYNEFKKFYFKILKAFAFDPQKDIQAANYLSQILKSKSNWSLENALFFFKNKIQEKNKILIYGCGPSLETTVNSIVNKRGKEFFKNFLNLAADGASVFLREIGLKIDSIFSDLDGITSEAFFYTDFIIVHAHGDNIKKLELYKENIVRFDKVIGTVQVEPMENLLNSGGFTDGDRILFFLRSLLNPNQRIYIIGFDFDDPIIGKYSKPNMIENQKGNPIKIKKLKFAKKLIEWLLKRMKNEIYFVNCTISTKNFNNISIETFLNEI